MIFDEDPVFPLFQVDRHAFLIGCGGLADVVGQDFLAVEPYLDPIVTAQQERGAAG